MEADNIAGGKEPKRLPVWACIPLFIVILFILLGLYGTLARGCLSLVLGVEARHPGVMGYIILEASMLLAVLTAAIPMLRFERRPFSDLGLSLKGHVKGLWYGFLMAILLYLFGFGISFVLGEIEVTGFQFKPLDLLGSWVFFLLVALFEEILMRGYILGRLLHTTMNKFLALFISAALFAFMHIFNPEIAFLPMLNLLLAGMLLAARDIVGGMYWVRSERQNEDLEKMAEKEKKRFAGTELLGKKLGVIGLGAIGILVANAAAALGMEVYGYDALSRNE